MRKFLLGIAALILSVVGAIAQSNPGLVYGQVPTAAQWNSYFSSKNDVLGYNPVNKAGDVMTGRLVTVASTTTAAGFNIPQGGVPSAPLNGDIWTTSSGMFVRINGATVGPLGTAGALVSCAQLPALTGDITTSAGSCATTLATVNANVGSFGSGTLVPTFTVNAKGLITAAGSTAVTPAWASITGTPTTLAGYGITSPLPKAQGGTAVAGPTAQLHQNGGGTNNGATVMWSNMNTDQQADHITVFTNDQALIYQGTIAGTPAAGNTLTITGTLNSVAFPIVYTVQAGATTSTIATAIAACLNGGTTNCTGSTAFVNALAAFHGTDGFGYIASASAVGPIFVFDFPWAASGNSVSTSATGGGATISIPASTSIDNAPLVGLGRNVPGRTPVSGDQYGSLQFTFASGPSTGFDSGALINLAYLGGGVGTPLSRFLLGGTNGSVGAHIALNVGPAGVSTTDTDGSGNPCVAFSTNVYGDPPSGAFSTCGQMFVGLHGQSTINPATSAMMDVYGTFRVVGSTNAPSTGVGLELSWDGAESNLLSFDRSGSLYKDIRLLSLATRFLPSNSATNETIIDSSGVYPNTTNTIASGLTANRWSQVNAVLGNFSGNLTVNVTGSTQCLHVNSSGVVSGTGSDCGSGSGGVTSVSNSDSTLTISPTTGAVVASLALGHANTWTAAQSHNSGTLKLNGASSGTTTLNAAAAAGTTTITLPGGTTDFSATGGAGQVVKQTSSGGAFTVATVAVSELSGLGTGVATFLATPSSANLAAAVTDETGSGALVFGTSPTFVTPTLGTPASGVATNLTGTASGLTAGNVTTNANLTGVITSVGNATSIASQTGTGTKFVVDTSPTLVTPVLGVATATSITAANHYGGSAAGSVLNLQSTSSGSPSGDSVTITAGGAVRATVLSGGNIGFGTETNPQYPFVVSQNTTTGLNTSGAVNGVTLFGANSTAPGFNVVTYGANGTNSFFRADSTAASPSNLGSGEIIGAFLFGGWGNGAAQGGRARILATTTEAWTSTTFGISLEFDTTAAGGSRAQAMLIKGGVIIGAGTTDPGANNLIVGGTVTISGIASDAAQTDNTVCINSSGLTLKGSGTLGICLGTSSARYKTDIRDLAYGLDKVVALSAKSFRLDAEHGNPDKVMFGFLAEDCARIIPELAGLDEQGRPNTCDYLGIVPLLVNAVKSLKAANDNLALEIKSLRHHSVPNQKRAAQ